MLTGQVRLCCSTQAPVDFERGRGGVGRERGGEGRGGAAELRAGRRGQASKE